jgi:tetratricopeptide (TPR) repeat protein
MEDRAQIVALVEQATNSCHLGHYQRAITIYDDLIASIGNASDLSLRVWVARALFGKAEALSKVVRYDQLITVYDDLISRFDSAEELPLREWVAEALFNKAGTLVPGYPNDAVNVYDAIVARFSTATEASLHEWIAKALLSKSVVLHDHLGRRMDAITVCDDIVNRFAAASEPTIREWVAEALFSKGEVFKVAGVEKPAHYDLAIAAYDDLIARFGDATQFRLSRYVARALLSKADALRSKAVKLNEPHHHDDAIAVYDDLVVRFAAAPELRLREYVAGALLSKGSTLQQLNRPNAAVAVYNNLVARFASEAALKDIVRQVRALNRGLKKVRSEAGNPSPSDFELISLAKERAERARMAINTVVAKNLGISYGIVIPWTISGAKSLNGNLTDTNEFDERGIPLKAPASWPGKDHSELPIDAYFRKWWAQYLKKGLTLSDIKRLDGTLHNSLKRHFRNKLPWPDDLEFPNERKTLQWAVAEFKKGNIDVLTPKQVIAVGRWLKRQEAQPKKPTRERITTKTPRTRARGLGS